MADLRKGYFSFGNFSIKGGGTLVRGDGGRLFSEPVVDSRRAGKGSLFVPLPGERADGHDFIPQALSAGAAGSLLTPARWESMGASLAEQFPHGTFIVSGDPLASLQSFARAYREDLLGGVRRIGITGSSGKTTFKEILAAILGQAGSVSANPGNLNSEIGLPLALLAVDPSADFAVLEMGMNHPGEMDILGDLFAPEVGIITNIGTAHVGNLGSRDNIAREKKKIFRTLPPWGGAFIWEDDPYFEFLSRDLSAPVYPYGLRSVPDFLGADDLGLRGWRLRFRGSGVSGASGRDREIEFSLPGRHHLINALGAVSAARFLGADMDALEAGLPAVRALFGRGQIIRGPVSLVLDFYNANPDSFRAGLEFFGGLPWEGRKILVAGAMGELGQDAPAAHRELGRLTLGYPLAGRFFFGRDMEEAFNEVRGASEGREARAGAGTNAGTDTDTNAEAEPGSGGDSPGGLDFWSADFDELLERIKNFIKPGDLVYIKGSRAMELERLVEPLECLYV